MSSSTWIAIYIPLFTVFIMILSNQRQLHESILLRRKKKKGLLLMTNEVLKKQIGNTCKISTGSFGTNVVGKIINVNENWIEVETKKGKELINAEFIQSIKINP